MSESMSQSENRACDHVECQRTLEFGSLYLGGHGYVWYLACPERRRLVSQCDWDAANEHTMRALTGVRAMRRGGDR